MTVPASMPAAPRRWRRRLLIALAALVALAVLTWTAFAVSPWPSALLIRGAFDREARRVAEALTPHVPIGVRERLDVSTDPEDRAARFDVFLPPAGVAPLPVTVVWIHGGAWISGDKAFIANYARILAGRGVPTVTLGYTIAPEATYPTAVRQVATTLAHLAARHEALGIPARFVLAGDSAGAQLAAQVATLVTSPPYATALGIAPPVEPARLAGTLLHCGAYDIDLLDFSGGFGGFLRTVFWSYSGRKDFIGRPELATISVRRWVTPAFPPTFISAGNGDPLLSQSIAFADTLAGHGVTVDRLFHPAGRTPPLGHEYQFDLGDEAGRMALERALVFLQRLAAGRTTAE